MVCLVLARHFRETSSWGISCVQWQDRAERECLLCPMGSMKRKSTGSPVVGEQSPALKAQRATAELVLHLDEPVDCLHEVSFPDGYLPPSRTVPTDSDAAPKKKAAKEYGFQLDPFQSEAIKCLDKGESVMVSAHTSTGKTVVALYAIAMSFRDNQRVINTSPIKALSNQKYRDFKEEFSDVGLMISDVRICPNSSCLVVTTEVWHNMQYRGSELLREVAWIIFDEVHYMQDMESGCHKRDVVVSTKINGVWP